MLHLRLEGIGGSDLIFISLLQIGGPWLLLTYLSAGVVLSLVLSTSHLLAEITMKASQLHSGSLFPPSASWKCCLTSRCVFLCF